MKQKTPTIEDFENDLLVHDFEGSLQSTVINPRICLLKPLYDHGEDSISPVDSHAVPPSLCDTGLLPVSLDKNVFAGADPFTQVHVVVVGAAVCAPFPRAQDGDFPSNMPTHLQNHGCVHTHSCDKKINWVTPDLHGDIDWTHMSITQACTDHFYITLALTIWPWS